jgi:hypothetical protein
MRKKAEKKNVDPLPLLLEAARRALREHLASTPFSHPDIESEDVGMWNENHMGAPRCPAQPNQGPCL